MKEKEVKELQEKARSTNSEDLKKSIQEKTRQLQDKKPVTK
jgi:hypothetical protein